MKRFILMSCMIGSIFVYMSDFDHADATYSAAKDRNHAKTETLFESANKIVTASLSPSLVSEAIHAVEATEAVDLTVPMEAEDPEKAAEALEATIEPDAIDVDASPNIVVESQAVTDKEPMNQTNGKLALQTVNDVSLYDDPTSLIKKLGQPELIKADEYMSEVETYQYGSMSVIFDHEIVGSLELEDLSKPLKIDDKLIKATIADIKAALGEPDFVTEDGIVFQREEALLKLFIDADTKELISISYFHTSSM